MQVYHSNHTSRLPLRVRLNKSEHMDARDGAIKPSRCHEIAEATVSCMFGAESEAIMCYQRHRLLSQSHQRGNPLFGSDRFEFVLQLILPILVSNEKQFLSSDPVQAIELGVL